ncbi:MAG: hypothetical protein KF709_02485 [Gemmatimonadaceae bacterium]|nr:hypothetical protein [Gemmatimonadaceae bacterium]
MSAPAIDYLTNGAPSVLHIDLAQLALEADRSARAVMPPMPHPEDAMERQLLDSAKDCAAGNVIPPRRELIAAALREAERQQWWRDVAEAEKAALLEKVEAKERAFATSDHELRTQRQRLIGVISELIGWASGVLGCAPEADEVLKRVRAQGSGLLRHEQPTDDMQRVRQEIANGH